MPFGINKYIVLLFTWWVTLDYPVQGCSSNFSYGLKHLDFVINNLTEMSKHTDVFCRFVGCRCLNGYSYCSNHDNVVYNCLMFPAHLSSHPARKFVMDFLRMIIVDSLMRPQSSRSAVVIDLVLEVSNLHILWLTHHVKETGVVFW